MFVDVEGACGQILGERGNCLITGTIDRFLATMSMSITSHVSSNNFFIAAAAVPELRPEKDCDALSLPLSDTFLNPDRNGSLVTAEIEIGERFGGAGSETSDVSGQRIFFREERTRHKSEGDVWIVVDGNVYDVTKFLGIHPGGPELILDSLASKGDAKDSRKDAGLLMRGKVNEAGHSHSKAAFQMLEQFLVGSIEDQPDGSAPVTSESNVNTKKYGYDVDLTKPIVSQVGYLGADYDEWVHDPVLSHDTPRFFESNFCEFFTTTEWWIIPLVWVPVAMAMIYTAIVKENVPLSRLPALTAGGILLWSSLEYLLHRFLFHMKTTSFWGNTVHYVLHGFHHKHPMDGSRLVFPPLFAAPLIVLIWIGLGRWAAEYPNKLVIFAFAVISYVVYDITHYFLHFGTAFNAHTRQMKRYHLDHHFKDQTMGFGITSTVWDKVFRTQPASKPSME